MGEPSIVGVWRLQRITRGDTVSSTSTTHLVIREDLLYYVSPRAVYEGELGPEREYSLEWGPDDGIGGTASCDGDDLVTPRDVGRLVQWADGAITLCALVHRSGDELRLRWGSVAGGFPRSIDDPDGSLDLYSRELDTELAARLMLGPTRAARAERRHARLGRLLRDENLGWWTARIAFDGVDELEASIDAPLDVTDAALDHAADLLARISCDSVKRFAAAQLLELHNESWRDEDSPALRPSEFVARMRACGITLNEDDVEVWFEDRDLFWGHSIVVRLDRSLSPTDADIAG
ncbi:MAG TPA: DUF2262 domain-containing protein [Nannocystaceae bacterium]|nr:DUF2262 domain-containing protein [Nannocystaceae bacterium]